MPSPGDLFITPSDVRTLIAKVDADMQILIGTANNCPQMNQDTRNAWEYFLSQWKTYDKDVSILPVSYLSQYHEVVQFQEEQRKWEDTFKAQGCGAVGPSIKPNPSPLGNAITSAVDKTAIIIGVGVVAIVGLLVITRK